MQVDFYEYACSVKAIKKFGIIDPDDTNGKHPARISYDMNSVDTWDATVYCNNHQDYSFIAVDNNIPLTRQGKNGNQETYNQCDAMLYTNQSVCFIELKRERSAYLQHAVEQLGATICAFGDEIEKFKYKKAYVCNKRHPQFHSSFSQTQTKFYKKYKVVLRVSVEIKELK